MTSNPPSADALRAAEASLTARAELRQAPRAVLGSGRPTHRGLRDGADPDQVAVRCRGPTSAPRSGAGGRRRSDVVRGRSAARVPRAERLGYDDDKITAIRIARRTEALDGAGVQFDGLLP